MSLGEKRGAYPCPKCGCPTLRIMCDECWRSEFPGISQAVRATVMRRMWLLAGLLGVEQFTVVAVWG